MNIHLNLSLVAAIGSLVGGLLMVVLGAGLFLESTDRRNPWEAIVATGIALQGLGFMVVGWMVA